MAATGPGSSVGFEHARNFNLNSRIGTATGIVVMGVFTLAVVAMGLIGLVLDLVSGGQWDLHSFRVAFATEFLMLAVGVLGVYRERRLTRKLMAERGVVVPPWSAVLRRERSRRARRR